jgi:surface polysaccharide O-acyltransferase-like enzyme
VEGCDGHVGEFFRRFYTQKIFVPYWFLYEYLGVLFVLPFLRKMMQNLTEQEEMRREIHR